MTSCSKSWWSFLSAFVIVWWHVVKCAHSPIYEAEKSTPVLQNLSSLIFSNLKHIFIYDYVLVHSFQMVPSNMYLCIWPHSHMQDVTEVTVPVTNRLRKQNMCFISMLNWLLDTNVYWCCSWSDSFLITSWYRWKDSRETMNTPIVAEGDVEKWTVKAKHISTVWVVFHGY